MRDYQEVMRQVDAFVDSSKALYGNDTGRSYALGYLMSMVATHISESDKKRQESSIRQLLEATVRNHESIAQKNSSE